MSKKKHSPGPVPPGNRPQAGPGYSPGQEDEQDLPAGPDSGAGFQEQDPQRRLGGFETAGEHSRQQPGRLNDGD
ncbi:MAG: hypothetical protein C0501_10110 [Isosphaera sp.]|nr:hypothetical protein [Isosphaera sp.]